MAMIKFWWEIHFICLPCFPQCSPTWPCPEVIKTSNFRVLDFCCLGKPVLWPMAKAGCFEVKTPRLCELPGTLPALPVGAPGTLGWLLNHWNSWNEMSFDVAKLGSGSPSPDIQNLSFPFHFRKKIVFKLDLQQVGRWFSSLSTIYVWGGEAAAAEYDFA